MDAFVSFIWALTLIGGIGGAIAVAFDVARARREQRADPQEGKEESGMAPWISTPVESETHSHQAEEPGPEAAAIAARIKKREEDLYYELEEAIRSLVHCVNSIDIDSVDRTGRRIVEASTEMSRSFQEYRETTDEQLGAIHDDIQAIRNQLELISEKGSTTEPQFLQQKSDPSSEPPIEELKPRVPESEIPIIKNPSSSEKPEKREEKEEE
jgi:hypothetical protein